MAKKVLSISLKGFLEGRIIREETKDSIEYFDLNEILTDFEGKEISISIKEENPVPTVRSI